MHITQDYLDDVLIRMAYHSSGIEGNTISLPQTVFIILERILPDGRKSIREFYEIENHRQAFNYLLSEVKKHEKSSIECVETCHELLMDRLQPACQDQTAAKESSCILQPWIKESKARLLQADGEDEILSVLADMHIQFRQIHPFEEGNGCTGRLLLTFLSMEYLSVPIIIRKEWRDYYRSFIQAQNVSGLTELFKESLAFERKRMVEFSQVAH